MLMIVVYNQKGAAVICFPNFSNSITKIFGLFIPMLL